jgi:ParB family chromosome partitioning protein
VILGLENPEAQNLAAERIIKAGLNVRQTEELVDHLQRPSATASPKGARAGALALRDAHVVELEHRLQERFGTRVSLRYRKGKGAVEIRFFSDEELERILQIAGITLD